MASIKKPHSKMYHLYFGRFFFRVAIVLFMFGIYFFRREWITAILAFDPISPPSWIHALWLILMAGMIKHLIPRGLITMGGRKSRPETYAAPQTPYERLRLLEYVQEMNIRAWRVMMVWLSAHGIIGILFLKDILGPEELVMLSMLYFLGDLVCILLFCPFQTFFMGCRCCVNCRIFDWGHFMMYTPMLFIPGFFSWSLLFTACIVLIRWEIVYARHPERFWEGSNLTLHCANCNEHLCSTKNTITQKVLQILHLKRWQKKPPRV